MRGITARVVLGVALLAAGAGGLYAQPTPPVVTGADVIGPVTPNLSRLPARELPVLDERRPIGPVRVVPRRRPGVSLELLPPPASDDPLAQRSLGGGRAPALTGSFDGISYTGSVFGVFVPQL